MELARKSTSRSPYAWLLLVRSLCCGRGSSASAHPTWWPSMR